jgi:RecJ-like exonuclease
MKLDTKNDLEILLFNNNIEIIETNNINGIKKTNIIDIYIEDIRIIIDALLKIEKYYNLRRTAEACPVCNGKGDVLGFPQDQRCYNCNGTGKLSAYQ